MTIGVNRTKRKLAANELVLAMAVKLLKIGVRYLTGGSDTGYVRGAGRADVKRLRELKLS